MRACVLYASFCARKKFINSECSAAPLSLEALAIAREDWSVLSDGGRRTRGPQAPSQGHSQMGACQALVSPEPPQRSGESTRSDVRAAGPGADPRGQPETGTPARPDAGSR